MNAHPTEPFPAELRYTLTVLARQLLAGAPNTASAREQTLLGIAALLLGTRHEAMDAVRAAQHQAPAHPLAQEQTLLYELRRRQAEPGSAARADGDRGTKACGG